MSEPKMLKIARTQSEPRELLVVCPRRDAVVRLERCLSCGFATGIEIAGPTDAFVRCYGEPAST